MKGLLSLLFFLLAVLQMQAQEPLSLEAAIKKGMEQHFQIRIADRELAIARTNNTYGAAGRYPTVNLLLNSNNGYVDQSNPASFLPELSSTSFGVTPGLDVSWVLFNGFQVRINKQRLDQLEQQSAGNARLVVEQTVQAIILAYYQALVQRDQLAVLEEARNLSRDRIRYQEARKEFGQAGAFDLLQAENAYLNDSAAFVQQANNLRLAMNDLQIAMGDSDLGAEYLLSDQLAVGVSNYELEQLRQKMLSDNQSLRNLYIARSLARTGSELAEAGRLPRLNLSTGLTYNTNLVNTDGMFADPGRPPLELRGATTRTFNGYVNLSASYTLFNGGNVQRQVAIARLQEEVAQLNVSALKQDLTLQLENAWSTYNNQQVQLSIAEALVQNARANMEIANERFRGGLISSFDYRTVQLNYIAASQSLLVALFNLKSTELNLRRLTGEIL